MAQSNFGDAEHNCYKKDTKVNKVSFLWDYFKERIMR
jgi:hypothetical protein